MSKSTLTTELLTIPGLPTLWLLGRPVSHSLSPLIQNSALQKLQRKILYLAASVDNEDFAGVVRSLPKMGAIGANVTVPHKVSAFQLCHEHTERAKKMGAVNTLIFRDNRIVGDNTDGIGWWNSLGQDCNPQAFQGAIVIGAGGAARAVCHTLLMHGISRLRLLNRTEEKARALVEELRKAYPGQNDVRAAKLTEFAELLERETLVVQTTSVGMKGEGSPVKLPDFWPQGSYLSELIYGRTTPLMKTVLQHGGACQDGLGMLCGQAAESLAGWLGVPFEEIPIDAMMKAARERITSP